MTGRLDGKMAAVTGGVSRIRLGTVGLFGEFGPLPAQS
jgi:hypothetical protein